MIHSLNYGVSLIPFVILMNWLHYRAGRPAGAVRRRGLARSRAVPDTSRTPRITQARQVFGRSQRGVVQPERYRSSSTERRYGLTNFTALP